MPAIINELRLGINYYCSCTACKSEFGSDEMDQRNPKDRITRRVRWDICPHCKAEGTVEFKCNGGQIDGY